MSLYHDPGVPVKLYVREESSDAVVRSLAVRGEAVIVNDLHELEIRNALRLKRFSDEIGDQQLAASMAMLASDLAAGRLIRGGIDWGSVCAEAERLSATMTVAVGVRTIDLLHVAAALDRMASGLVSLDHRQCAAARASGFDVIELPAWRPASPRASSSLSMMCG